MARNERFWDTLGTHLELQHTQFFFFFLFFFFFVFLELHQWHMEVPRLGVELELWPLVYATATATRDLSRICDIHHSSW